MRAVTTYDEHATQQLTLEEITSKNIKIDINNGTATETHRDYVWLTDGRVNFI